MARIFKWGGDKEEGKVIIDKSRLLALVRCLIHVIPMAAAVGLIGLNASNYYIGGELEGQNGQDTQKLAALLFAAKLHELFMLASLATLLITYIRMELVFGDGLPFGAVFSAQQFTNISFLWSLELWGAIYHKWEKRGKKWFILSLLIVCTLLGVSVGPSTGVLMRPRLDDWPAGGTPFWINATTDALFPSILQDSPELQHCETDTNDLACPAGAWETLKDSYLSFFPQLTGMGSVPQHVVVPGKHSVRTFVLRSRNTQEWEHRLLWANAFTMATVPVSAVADAVAEFGRLWTSASANGEVGRLRFRKDAIFTAKSEQPIVLVRCSHSTAIELVPFGFPALNSLELSKGPGSAAQLSSVARVTRSISFDNVTETDLLSMRETDTPSLLWIDSPELSEPANSTLGVIVSIPNPDTGSSFYGCSVDSRFAKTKLRSTKNLLKHVSGEISGSYDRFGTFLPEYRPVRLTSEWARYLNPTLDAGANSTVFASLARAAGLWNTTKEASGVYRDIIIENILATMIANGIGRASYNTTLHLGFLKDPINTAMGQWVGGGWEQEVLTKNGEVGKGGNAFNIPEAVQRQSTMIQMDALVTGYAYTSLGKTQKAAIAVLSAYVLLALSHILFSLVTGHSTTKWGSGAEMAALGVNSESAVELKNTGAGISTVGVFTERVKVEVKEEHVQMIFESTANSSSSTVEPNKEYA